MDSTSLYLQLQLYFLKPTESSTNSVHRLKIKNAGVVVSVYFDTHETGEIPTGSVLDREAHSFDTVDSFFSFLFSYIDYAKQ